MYLLTNIQPALFINPPGDTLLLRNLPDHRDDYAEALFATDFSAISAVAMHTVDWQRIRYGQRGKRGRGSIYE